MDENDTPLPILEHWSELRRRLLICLGSVFLFSLVSYFFSDHLIRLLTKPFNRPLIFLSPTEGFSFIIKVSIFSGIILSTPVICYHLWKFISVTLNKNVKKQILYNFLASITLAVVGIMFSYFLVIPAALTFLMGLSQGVLTPFITVNNYFSFMMTLILAFAFVFQLPLVMIFLVRNNLVSLDKFSGNRHYAILLIFIAAAVLTPTPDAFTQLCLAIPLILLYEGSILFLRIF
jgi:sec-independent protein translocase protein TatC